MALMPLCMFLLLKREVKNKKEKSLFYINRTESSGQGRPFKGARGRKIVSRVDKSYGLVIALVVIPIIIWDKVFLIALKDEVAQPSPHNWCSICNFDGNDNLVRERLIASTKNPLYL